MSKWLKDFAYRTDICWWVFVVAGAWLAYYHNDCELPGRIIRVG